MRAFSHALGLVLVLAGYALVSCVTHEIPSGNGSSGDDDDGGEQTAADLPACPYARNIAGGTAMVTYGRVFLDCELGSGGEECVSNDPTVCPDHGSSVNGGGTTISCSNQCADDQFAISVDLRVQTGADGGELEPTSPDIPATCDLTSENPGGGAVYCCDCPATN